MTETSCVVDTCVDLSLSDIGKQIAVYAVFDDETKRLGHSYASKQADDVWVLPDPFH